MHDVAWRGMYICVRSKDAQKQLARTSLKVDVVVTFCGITLSSCFARVFILRATSFNYMLLSFNIISKSCSIGLFSCQIKKLGANVSLVRAIFWYVNELVKNTIPTFPRFL